MASLYILAVLFLGVSAIYASLGLGGGTIYVPVLAIFGVQAANIPTLSLALNIVATTLGSIIFLRAGFGRVRLIVPFAVSSIPAAYVGGRIAVEPVVFYWVLVAILASILMRILVWDRLELSIRLGRGGQWSLAFMIGAGLGLVAGIAGIGGGIFLIPAIMMLRLGTRQEAAACAAVFTWANSVAGFVARVQSSFIDWDQAVPLIVAVALGSILGARFGSKERSSKLMQPILAGVIAVAIVFLLLRILRGG